MRDVILYIAMSLDGYIADSDGGVAWLGGDGSESDAPGSYPRFIDTVDTILLGRTTYRQIATELSPGNWPYAGKRCYILTHTPEPSTDELIFTDEDPRVLIPRLRAQEGRDIWICGGASIVNQLLGPCLIDRIHITVIPIVLGGGIPLFHGLEQPFPLRLCSTERYNGMVDLIYEKREARI